MPCADNDACADTGLVAENSDAIAQIARERDAARAASAAKSRFLANISHEIRAPLNAIYGYAQLVEQQAGIDPVEAARVIRRSAEHLTNLVEGLLDISLVENGVLRVDSEVVRLPAFIDQIVSMFRPAAAAQGLAFRYVRPDHLPEFVRTDPKRLRQMLINLVSNAIKFTTRGEVVLAVAYSGQVATFEVRDTGPGVAAADRERIFGRFERDDGTGQAAGGFGLGLPITRAIVQILGGELELESEPGKGSCFRVALMLAQVPGFRESGTPQRPVTGYEGARRSVLVVDDDADQLGLMRHVLEGLGFEVALAPDGPTALALCDGTMFDLALLDRAMPGMSGWDVAAHLRATQGRDLRIVMLSGDAHERHGPAGAEHDHDHFLVKPIAFGELIDTIGDQLGIVWMRAEPAGPNQTAKAPYATHLTDNARAHVDRLRNLLKIGHVRAIEAEVEALARAAPQAGALVATLYACLDRFDLAALGRALERY